MTPANKVNRKDSHNVDISNFRALAVDAHKRIPKKLLDVCMIMSQVTEIMVAAGTPIDYGIADRMGKEIEKYLYN